jgi:aspartate racemase
LFARDLRLADTLVHQVIYDELVQGVVRDESRDQHLQVISRLCQRGAEGFIAGCTEIELLVHDHHLSVPYFPTTRLHALAAVDNALAGTWKPSIMIELD